VRFDYPGIYRLKLEATDSELSASDTVEFTIVDYAGKWMGHVDAPEPYGNGWLSIVSRANASFTGTLRVRGRRVSVRGAFGGNGEAEVPVRLGTLSSP
jgi:hypothetical protein